MVEALSATALVVAATVGTNGTLCRDFGTVRLWISFKFDRRRHSVTLLEGGLFYAVGGSSQRIFFVTARANVKAESWEEQIRGHG